MKHLTIIFSDPQNGFIKQKQLMLMENIRFWTEKLLVKIKNFR